MASIFDGSEQGPRSVIMFPMYATDGTQIRCGLLAWQIPPKHS